MRNILIPLFLLLIAEKMPAQRPGLVAYPADSVRQSMSELFTELSKKHPGFYRYHAKTVMDAFIDSTLQTVRDSLTEVQIYRKIKPVFAKIGCLHTDVSTSPAYQNWLKSTNTLLPLRVYVQGQRAFIIQNYSSDATVPIGSEVLEVNGIAVAAIIRQLLAAIPSDGYNESEKILLLRHHFAEWYRAICEVTERFHLTIRTGPEEKEYTLQGVNSAVFPLPAPLQGERLGFRLQDSLAVLTIRSFARSEIKAAGQHYKSFLRKTFKRLDREQVPHLVLDLRYNTGGTDANAALLCTYLMNTPYRYWSRIEATKAFAESIKGLASLMYRKPTPTDSLYQWRKSRFTREFDFYEPQKPAKHTYKGKLYVLINGLCLSSCSDLTAVLSHNQRGVFVGQETGGGYQGNTSGLMPEVKLPVGLTITVPLLKYTNAVTPGVNHGRGTMPNHSIVPTVQEVIEGTDVEMKYVRNLISKFH